MLDPAHPHPAQPPAAICPAAAPRVVGGLLAVGTLEADYESMFRMAVLLPRHRNVIQAFFGLSPAAPLTLQETGDAVRLTRERVRQVSDTFIDALRGCHPERFPAVRLAAERLCVGGPRLVGEVGGWLVGQNLTRTAVSGEGLLKLLRYMKVRLPSQLSVLPGGEGKRDRDLRNSVEKIVGTLSGSYGAVTLENVLRAWDRRSDERLTKSELVVVLGQLKSEPAVNGDWVRLAGSKRDRLAHTLSKIGRLGRRHTVQELSAAWLKVLHRASASFSFALPPEVMEVIVRSTAGWKKDPDGLWSTDARPAGAEDDIETHIIMTLGGTEIVSRAKILQRLKDLGHAYKPGHVSLYLSSSPLLTRLNAGYKLLGVP